MIRVLMVTGQLPVMDEPNMDRHVSRLAPVVRQIESVRKLGAEVRTLQVSGIRRLKYLQAIPRLWAMASGVDIVHAHYGLCGVVARAQLGKPLVVSFMGSDLLGGKDANGNVGLRSKIEVKVNQALARVADAVVVKSAEMARAVAPVESYIVPNGVDLYTFRAMDGVEARAALKWPENRRYVLFPGSPSEPVKGYSVASAVWLEASKNAPYPIDLIPLWGVAPDKVPLYMNASHALLLSSFSEGSPNVVKEALACNLPVVSVPVGDVPELLAGVEGCAIGSRDVKTMAQVLLQVLDSGKRPDGRAALERKGLNVDDVGRRVMDIYEEVLTRRQSSLVSERKLNA